MRIAFSLASVPELQKNAFVKDSGVIEISFSAARARAAEASRKLGRAAQFVVLTDEGNSSGSRFGRGVRAAD